MHLTLDKIPKHVLHEVLDKWKRILAIGEWTSSFWQPCALCHYMDEHYGPHECTSFCPLDTHYWCCETAHLSRLNFKYHLNRNLSENQSHEAWLTSVERFVNMLTRHLEPPNLAILWRYLDDPIQSR